MTIEFSPGRRAVHCDDAPVSTCETAAEAAAREAQAVRAASPFTWDERELARSALGDLPEDARAAFLTDLLCELLGPEARTALAIARNRITSRLHDLITEEYDAEIAKTSGQDVAELARDDEPRQFFRIDPASVARLREARVERAKKAVGRICDHVVARLAGQAETLLDHDAQVIARLLIGEKAEG